jgi:TolB-like protein/Tfp pilus assembly protein PilF
MSPEQLAGHTATPAADQYSLGIVVYECLTGVQPFAGDTFAAIVHGVLNRTPDPPSGKRPGINPAWDEVVLKALAKDPEARHATITAFARSVAATRPVAPRPAAAAGPPRSLAVLYFDNLSSDPESDYFCAGITEDLLTDLSKVQGLGVASRNAVGRYRHQTVDIPRIAAELGVAAVLEGSVRKAGNRVRINAQLIDASSGMHLWADRYDRTLDDVFAVQDDITASIAKALRSTLTPTMASEIQAARPDDVHAYDQYLRGRELYDRYTELDMGEAIRRFEEAVRIDPGYALAWAGIADGCGQMVDKAWDLDPAGLERGEQAARRAVALAPRLPEAHKALALILNLMSRREEARQHLVAALEINPKFVPALTNVGSLRLQEGDVAGAERCIRRAIQIDPTHAYPQALLSFIAFDTRRLAEAISLSHAVERWGSGPTHQAIGRYVRVIANAAEGRWDTAHSEAEALGRVGSPDDLSNLAHRFVDVMAGESVPIPPVPTRATLFFSTDLHVLLGFAARDPVHTVDALHRAEELDPHSWTSNPNLMRAHWLMPPSVRSSPEMRDWLGDRGRSIIWPAEAPLPPEEVRAEFTDFRVESGIPPAEGMP